jgi:acetolactate synthase-1/3 small subunit
VIHCVDHTDEDVVLKELALVKLAVGAENRGEVLQIVDHFGGKTVDLTDRSLILMATGNADKLDALIGLLKKFRIVELIRTGKVVMARGEEET